MAYMGKESKKRMDIYICVCITDSLCCTPETNTTLQINYTAIKNLTKKNTCIMRMFRKCSHHHMCYWMHNCINKRSLPGYFLIIFWSDVYTCLGCVCMRVFLYEISIWVIGLSEADCPPQCRWPAQVNIGQSTEGLNRAGGRGRLESPSLCLTA